MGIKTSEMKSEKLDLRLSLSAKATLQMAAVASGRKLTEFVLESALDRAKGMLPDRQIFGLNAEQWKAFQAALVAPPRDMSRLAELLREPSVFEKGL